MHVGIALVATNIHWIWLIGCIMNDYKFSVDKLVLSTYSKMNSASEINQSLKLFCVCFTHFSSAFLD